MIRTIDHLVITAANPEQSIAFYQKLGFTARDAGGRYELFAGDFKINLHVSGRELLPHAKRVQPGSADLCFELTGGLADFSDGLLQQGIVIELGPVQRFGTKGAMQSVYLRDPDGNLLEFCSYQTPDE